MQLERLGTLRRLARLSTEDGFFCVAALDHPENYLALFDSDVTRVPHDTVVASKLELVAELSGHTSALLLDPVWSLGQAIAARAVPGSVGLITSIELLGYAPQSPLGWEATTRLRPAWTPGKIANLGADGVKLVVFYRSDLAEVAAEQHKLVAGLAASCRNLQLPLVIEPLWYPIGGEDPSDPDVARQRAAAIVASAADFAVPGVEILKMQFPGSVASASHRASAAAAASELDASVNLPWVLLSEGAGYEDFAVQMQLAAQAGASGYIAGRAVWGDAVGPTRDARAVKRAGERLEALNTIVREHGRPWDERVAVDAVAAALPPDWYESYGRDGG